MRFVGSLLAVLVAATTNQLVVASNATYRSSRVAVHIPFSLHEREKVELVIKTASLSSSYSGEEPGESPIWS
jgi:hypothetical protein